MPTVGTPVFAAVPLVRPPRNIKLAPVLTGNLEMLQTGDLRVVNQK